MSALRFRMTNVLLGLVLISLLALIAMVATDVRGGPLDPPGAPASTDSVKLPGTPISTAPFTISASGHYYLTRNLDYNGTGAAISFADHVDSATLDLNGFTVTGFNTGTGIRALGPSAPSQFPLEIKNGYVRNFTTGVDVQLSAHARIDGVHVFTSTGNGIVLGNHGVVTNCTAANSSGHGILIAGSLNAIDDCMIVDNTQSGVEVSGNGNVIEGSQILRNNRGVHFVGGSDSILRGNDILFDSSVSIFIDLSNGNSVLNNVYCDLDLGGTGNQLLGNIVHCE